jgi:sulfonate transport system permease protein
MSLDQRLMQLYADPGQPGTDPGQPGTAVGQPTSQPGNVAGQPDAGHGQHNEHGQECSDGRADRLARTRRLARAHQLARSKSLRRLISPLAVLVSWQAVTTAGLVSAQKLPPPTEIWHTAVSLITTSSPAYGTLQGAMLVSLQRVAVGFAFGAAVSVILATVAGLSRFGENAVDPLLQMLRTLPLFGLIPVFIVWFGIGELPKLTLIALGAAIPLYLNTFAGIRGVDAKLAELGQVLHLRRTELIKDVVLPGALPQVLVGLRQSLGVAWLALVVAEQVNANAGLGFMISQATQFLRNDVIFVALLVYCCLGLLTDALVRLLERRALGWRRGFLER